MARERAGRAADTPGTTENPGSGTALRRAEALWLPESAPRGAAGPQLPGSKAQAWSAERRSPQQRRRLLLASLPSHCTVRGRSRGTAPVRLRLRLSPLRLPPSFSSSSSTAAGARVLILPPPPSSASSPQARRLPLHDPKHKHTSPGLAAISAARRQPRRHVAARSALRPFVTSGRRWSAGSIRSVRYSARAQSLPILSLETGLGEAAVT